MTVICWLDAARVALDGASLEEGQAAAVRWCGTVVGGRVAERGVTLCLMVPQVAGGASGTPPARIRIGMHLDAGGDVPELRIGPHALLMGSGAESDRIRCSTREPLSVFESDLLVDLGINHLLARQGLPVLHSCSFEVGGVSVLGLGESFSGKTTVSVAAMRAGGRVVSDDLVLAVPGKGSKYSLLPVRSYGWLRGRTREIVPADLQEKMVETDESGQPRWVINREDGGNGFVGEMTPGVIWVQSVDRRLKKSRIEAIDHGQVFAALIRASSPLYLSRHCPEIRDKLIPVFRSLCEQCRGYRVRLAPRLLEDPVGEMERLVDLSRRRSADPNYEL